jgi:hypothetical protein
MKSSSPESGCERRQRRQEVAERRHQHEPRLAAFARDSGLGSLQATNEYGWVDCSYIIELSIE